MISGVLSAVVTPFTEQGDIDIKSFDNFIQWQIAEGIDGLVVCGTTGESATLSHDEHMGLIAEAVKLAKKRVPVVAGAGSNSTKEAIELAKHAQISGADALLVVTPYYNKPCQEGLFVHYSAIAESVDLPIIIYNIPGRSVVDIMPQTMAKLREKYKHIIGVKDATGCIARVAQQRMICGKGFLQFSGSDSMVVGFNAQGGHGSISVTSNVAPALCALMHKKCREGDYKAALDIDDIIAPLNEALFIEPNPAGVKYALSLLGLMQPYLRSPMVMLTKATQARIYDAMQFAKLL